MGVFAVHIIKPDGAAEINYIHKDHLGSWNTITDESGKLLQELSFDGCSVKPPLGIVCDYVAQSSLKH